MIDGIHAAQVGAADQLIERRQGGRQLRNRGRAVVEQRHKRPGTARIGGITEAELALQGRYVTVGLPSGRAVHERRPAEDLHELITGEGQLAACPRLTRPGDAILPAHVIPGVHADLEPALRNVLQLRGAAPADVRARQEHSVQQRLQAVVLQHRGALHLAEEAAAQDALDRSAGVIGAEAEEEGRRHAQALQQVREARRAFARAAIGVDVDLEGNQRHGQRSGNGVVSSRARAARSIGPRSVAAARSVRTAPSAQAM